MKKSGNRDLLRILKVMLVLVLAFTMIFGTGAMPFAGWSYAAETESMDGADAEIGADEAGNTDYAYDGGEFEDGDASSDEEGDDSDAGDSEEATEEATDAADESAEDALSLEQEDPELAVEAAESGDFMVTGDDGSYSFDEATGVLTITGDVTVAMKDGVGKTSQSIIVSANCKVTLAGINIEAAKGPAILIESPYNAELVLAEGTENSVTGANGVNINHVAGSFAGIEVEFEYEDGENPSNKMASLTISGSGTLNATGGPNAAGIGGSNSAGGSKGKGLYGNITINGGTINATAPGSGAGIGSSDNPGDGTSTGSYKKTGNNTWGVITINGGTVNAKSTASGAGIGGGNHVDSGKIVINGGKVTADGAAGIGCGIGSSKNKGNGGDKGPGYYAADIEINGGDITATSNDIGAAIGGGMYCDAVVKITGGTINATGGSRSGNTHHGGAGIGGGYLGHADITISGGAITAVGGDGAAGIGSGGSPNSKDSRGTNGRGDSDITTVDYTSIKISGGTIDAQGGPQGGAGIGLGVGADKAVIEISGGTITAQGAKSSRDDDNIKNMKGGAGIGSAYVGEIGDASKSKYFVEADVDITITAGDIIAIGGWGASGIGSGALNKMADTITIDAESANIQAYADGTKFAIDTRDLQADGTTQSHTEGRTITGDLLQGTFVHKYETEDVKQNPEGLKTIVLTNDNTGDSKTLKLMPEGYRSFATDVADPGTFTVYTDEESIGDGQGRYFSQQTTDVYNKEEAEKKDNTIQYTVETGTLSDNFYLFPVKSVIVEKIVDGAESDLEGLNTTAYFAVCYKNGDGETVYLTNEDGTIWTKSIEIVNGKPQGKAYFINLDDKTYDIREIKGADDTGSPIGEKFGALTLSRITTQHGEAFGLDEAAEHGLAVTRSASDDGGKITITATLTDHESSVSLSLFANDKLASESMKLNEDSDWTATWTVDEKDADGNLIEYKLADTSNNATIDSDNWSDEVKVINTYEGDNDIELMLTKAVDKYFDASETSDATFVFKVEAFGEDETAALYEGYFSLTFTDAKDRSEVIAIRGISGIKSIKVTEVYGPGYSPEGEAEKTVTIGSDNADKNEDGQYLVSFTNKFDDKVVQGSGIRNHYEDGQYVEEGGRS